MSNFTSKFIGDNDKYERSKIGKLRNEREEIQAKTYKNWINSILIQGRTGIDDIYTDFTNGEKLIILLQLLTGEHVGQINKSSSLLHKIANVSQCLEFIKNKNVHLESIGPDDIVNGNKKLTLGLIWTLILRFQLSKHLDFGKCDLKSIKESLLMWCRNKTKHLEWTNIIDFHRSWQNGWAFIALVYSFRPESFKIELLRQKADRELLAIAFDTAYQQLMIPKILDIDDVINSPDENSILTYVSYFYNLHNKTKCSEKNVKRIKYLLTHIIDTEIMENNYLNLCRALLDWIANKSSHLEREVNVECAQEEMFEFNNYFFNDRLEKLKLRNECESLYFEIVSMQKKAGVRTFIPNSGLMVKDLEKAWLQLEQIETRRQSKLKDLINQHGKLSKQAQLFDLKSRKFENYVASKLELLNRIFVAEKKTTNKEHLETHLRLSESICHDIISNNIKSDSLIYLANELIEQKHNDSQFYIQYKIHINEKLKKLHELASFNLSTIELTRHLFSDLSIIESVSKEIEDLYRQLNLIIIPDENLIQNIFLILENLKHFEIYLDVLEKKSFESRCNFTLINEKYNHQKCFIILDIEFYEKKLNDSCENINLCRNIIENNKRKLNYQLEWNEFKTNIDCINQFLNEKRAITKSNLNECFNSSNIHFIQRRNNIIKLEMKVMEKELYSTCKKGYLLLDANPKIPQTINRIIEEIKTEFQNLITVINERTLLINDCITLLNLINDLNQHETLFENFNDNFFERFQEKIHVYQNDLLYLSEILDKFRKLSIYLENHHNYHCKNNNNIEDETVSSRRYIAYLNNYHLDQIDFSSSYIYLILEIDHLPHIQHRNFPIINLNLFELIKIKMSHIKQLLLLTEYDFDKNKLKQMLDVNCDKEFEDFNQSKISTFKSENVNPKIIDLLFKLFFEKENLKDFDNFLKQRSSSVISDFTKMNELISIIKHTIKLIDIIQNIMDLCNENKIEHNNDKDPVIAEEDQTELYEWNTEIKKIEVTFNKNQNNERSQNITIENDSCDLNQLNEIKKETQIPIDESHDNISPVLKKKKIFFHKLKHEIIFINQCFLEANPRNLKFKLNFLKHIIDENVKRIEIYIIQYPDDKNILALSNKLIEVNDKITNYQTLSTFKDFINDFYQRVTNDLDCLQCLKIYPNKFKRIFQENHLHIDINSIESIEILFPYYYEQLEEFKKESDYKQFSNELIVIFDKYEQIVKSIKKMLFKKRNIIKEKRKKECYNFSLEDKSPFNQEKILPIDMKFVEINDNDPVKIANDLSNKNSVIPKLEYKNEMDKKHKNNDDKIQNLLRDLEVSLFDINCGINIHKYKQQQIEEIYTKAVNLSKNDPKMLEILNNYKKRLDQMLKQQIHKQNLKQFQNSFDHILNCCRQDIDTIDEIIQNAELPLGQIRKQLINKKSLFKFNYVHYKTLFDITQNDFYNNDQCEIRSKLVFLQNVLNKLKSKIEQFQSFLEIEEQLNSISSDIESIFSIMEKDDHIDDATLKVLQIKTNQTKNLLQQIDAPFESFFYKEVNRLNTSIRKASIIIRYQILKNELNVKFKNYKTLNDKRFQEFISNIQQQKDFIENVLLNFKLNQNEDQKLLNILNNWSILINKLDSFSHLPEVDSFRKHSLETKIDSDIYYKNVPEKYNDNFIYHTEECSQLTNSLVFDQKFINDEIINIKTMNNDRLLSFDSILQDESLISSNDNVNNCEENIYERDGYSFGSQSSYYYSEHDIVDDQQILEHKYIKSSTPFINNIELKSNNLNTNEYLDEIINQGNNEENPCKKSEENYQQEPTNIKTIIQDTLSTINFDSRQPTHTEYIEIVIDIPSSDTKSLKRKILKKTIFTKDRIKENDETIIKTNKQHLTNEFLNVNLQTSSNIYGESDYSENENEIMSMKSEISSNDCIDYLTPQNKPDENNSKQEIDLESIEKELRNITNTSFSSTINTKLIKNETKIINDFTDIKHQNLNKQNNVNDSIVEADTINNKSKFKDNVSIPKMDSVVKKKKKNSKSKRKKKNQIKTLILTDDINNSDILIDENQPEQLKNKNDEHHENYDKGIKKINEDFIIEENLVLYNDEFNNYSKLISKGNNSKNIINNNNDYNQLYGIIIKGTTEDEDKQQRIELPSNIIIDSLNKFHKDIDNKKLTLPMVEFLGNLQQSEQNVSKLENNLIEKPKLMMITKNSIDDPIHVELLSDTFLNYLTSNDEANKSIIYLSPEKFHFEEKIHLREKIQDNLIDVLKESSDKSIDVDNSYSILQTIQIIENNSLLPSYYHIDMGEPKLSADLLMLKGKTTSNGHDYEENENNDNLKLLSENMVHKDLEIPNENYVKNFENLMPITVDHEISYLLNEDKDITSKVPFEGIFSGLFNPENESTCNETNEIIKFPSITNDSSNQIIDSNKENEHKMINIILSSNEGHQNFKNDDIKDNSIKEDEEENNIIHEYTYSNYDKSLNDSVEENFDEDMIRNFENRIDLIEEKIQNIIDLFSILENNQTNISYKKKIFPQRENSDNCFIEPIEDDNKETKIFQEKISNDSIIENTSMNEEETNELNKKELDPLCQDYVKFSIDNEEKERKMKSNLSSILGLNSTEEKVDPENLEQIKSGHFFQLNNKSNQNGYSTNNNIDVDNIQKVFDETQNHYNNEKKFIEFILEQKSNNGIEKRKFYQNTMENNGSIKERVFILEKNGYDKENFTEDMNSFGIKNQIESPQIYLSSQMNFFVPDEKLISNSNNDSLGKETIEIEIDNFMEGLDGKNPTMIKMIPIENKIKLYTNEKNNDDYLGDFNLVAHEEKNKYTIEDSNIKRNEEISNIACIEMPNNSVIYAKQKMANDGNENVPKYDRTYSKLKNDFMIRKLKKRENSLTIRRQRPNDIFNVIKHQPQQLSITNLNYYKNSNNHNNNNDNILKYVGRVARYSLPFYLFILILLCLLIILTKHECESDCLRWKEYALYVTKSYPYGPPSI